MQDDLDRIYSYENFFWRNILGRTL